MHATTTITHCDSTGHPVNEVRSPQPRSMEAEVLQRFPALKSFAARVGNTPLMEIPPSDEDRGRQSGCVLAKCEWHNPAGSIKDRPTYWMLLHVLREYPEAFLRDTRLLEYSGGNVARSLARLSRILGLSVTLVLMGSTDPRDLDALEAAGADLRLVPRARGFPAVIDEAMTLSRDNPDWVFLHQHRNLANPEAHRLTTGAEILRQGGGRRFDAVVAAVGTGGTLTGIYDALAADNPALAIYTVMPAEMPYGTLNPPNGLRKFAGSGGFGFGRRQLFVRAREAAVRGHLTYPFDVTLRCMRSFYLQTGQRIGTSAAANLLAAREVAARLGPGSTIVTVFPDAGSASEWEAADRA